MDDLYALNVAKTEYREGYNTGDIDRVLAVFSDELLDMSDGEPSRGSSDSKLALRLRLQDLFAQCRVTLHPIIIDFEVKGDQALDYGWHKLTLEPRQGGAKQQLKERYFERWEKKNGDWKITFLITNKEQPPVMVPADQVRQSA
jgi:ketosteroid isomerase-like protein